MKGKTNFYSLADVSSNLKNRQKKTDFFYFFPPNHKIKELATITSTLELRNAFKDSF